MAGGEPDIPRCDLPVRKKAVHTAKPRAKRKAKPDPDAEIPRWDPAEEARKAREAVASKGKRKLIEAPEGAVVIPGVSKRKRIPPPPTKIELPPKAETKREAKARLREEAKALEPDPSAKALAILTEARAVGERVVTDEIFFDILILVAQGMTLRQVFRLPGMPSRMSFYRYVDCEDQAEAGRRMGRLARARAMGLEEIAEEILDIADDGSNDWVEREKDGATLVEVDREHLQRSKLRVETRLKLLAVWDPTRYGARLAHTDPDGKPLGTAGGVTASDLAIGLAKLVEAARRNDLVMGNGIVIDQDAAA